METGANVPLYGPYSKKYLGLSKIVPRAQAPGGSTLSFTPPA